MVVRKEETRRNGYVSVYIRYVKTHRYVNDDTCLQVTCSMKQEKWKMSGNLLQHRHKLETCV